MITLSYWHYKERGHIKRNCPQLAAERRLLGVITAVCYGCTTPFHCHLPKRRGILQEVLLEASPRPEPRIVVESDWSESFPHLRSDKNLWLKGNASVVRVILPKWSALSYGRIKGTAQIPTCQKTVGAVLGHTGRSMGQLEFILEMKTLSTTC